MKLQSERKLRGEGKARDTFAPLAGEMSLSDKGGGENITKHVGCGKFLIYRINKIIVSVIKDY